MRFFSKPRILSIGGGTGLSTLLRGLKNGPAALSVIVTVTDDGGSSGRLREDLGVMPPGDIRNCMIALSEDENLMSRLFRFRFEGKGELHNHSFGNLFLSAMAGVTRDSVLGRVGWLPKVVVSLVVVLLIPIFAYSYGRVASAFLKLIKME